MDCVWMEAAGCTIVTPGGGAWIGHIDIQLITCTENSSRDGLGNIPWATLAHVSFLCFFYYSRCLTSEHSFMKCWSGLTKIINNNECTSYWCFSSKISFHMKLTLMSSSSSCALQRICPSLAFISSLSPDLLMGQRSEQMVVPPCWTFLPVKREFFLPAVAKFSLIRDDLILSTT